MIEFNELDKELQFFMKNIDQYEIGKYIEQVAYFTYKFIVIHPFRDENESLVKNRLVFFN